MIPAFRFVDGVLVHCADVGPVMHFMREQSSDLRTFRSLRSLRQERRSLARRSSGRHRHRARAVPHLAVIPAPTYWTLHGHTFSNDAGREAILYLPEGERPTEKHSRAIDRAMRKHTP